MHLTTRNLTNRHLSTLVSLTGILVLGLALRPEVVRASGVSPATVDGGAARSGVLDTALTSILSSSGPCALAISVRLQPVDGATIERTREAFLAYLEDLRSAGVKLEVAPVCADPATVALRATAQTVRDVANLPYVARIRLNQRGAPVQVAVAAAALPDAGPVDSGLATARADALARYAKAQPGDDVHVMDGIRPRIKSCGCEGGERIAVVCQLFGGITGTWHGRAMRFEYDALGHFVSEAVLQ